MKPYKQLLIEKIMNIPRVEGNGKVLVLIDSRASFSEMLVVKNGILPTLTHYGLPFAIHDLAKSSLKISQVLNSRVVVIAHERIVRNFALETIKALEEGLKEGIGLVNLDGDLYYASSQVKKILDISLEEAPLLTNSLQFSPEENFITRFKEPGEKLSWEKPLTLYWTEEMENDWEVLVNGIMGKEQLIIARHLIPNIAVIPGQYPAIALKNKNKGRVVQWFISPRILLSDFLGHLKGMDDILANSIIWAAKKPFIYNSFPPFVTFKIDDVSGEKKLKWLKIATDLGFKCAPPIFIDRIKDDSLKVARDLQDEGKAEFPCHALKYYELMGFKFGYGPYQKEEVTARYDKMKKFYAKNGLKIPETWQCHWGEIAMNELEEIKKLGIKYILGYFLADDAKHNRLNWYPQPYGSTDLFYDYSPDDPEIIRFDSMIRGPHLDFLEGLTVLAGHSAKNEIDAKIKSGTKQILWGLSNGFFGQLVTHEQKVAVIENEDWETILSTIKKNIEKFNPQFVLHNQIATYIESKMSSQLKTINIKEGELLAEFEGKSPCDIFLTKASGEKKISLDFVPIRKFKNGVRIKEQI